MDKQAKLVIDTYIDNVNSVCHNLLEGINSIENLQLKTKWDFFEYVHASHKMDFDVNGIHYELHGRGCFAFCDELFLDWDFGYRSRWCGIDPWMLGMTLKKNESQYIEYYDGKLLKEICQRAVIEGEMFEKNGLYHYSIPISETFVPDFPKDYDMLIIEHGNRKWELIRNKVIDRFLRKSNRIHNQIYNSEDAYFLRFFLNGIEVYSIPYDDICYPESAIKIMTDDILRNIKRKSF